MRHGALAVRVATATVIAALPVLIYPLHDMLTDGTAYAWKHHLIVYQARPNTTAAKRVPFHRCRRYGKPWKQPEEWFAYTSLDECKLTCAACGGCTGFTCRANASHVCPWKPPQNCGKHGKAKCPLCAFFGESVVLESSTEDKPENFFFREGTLAPLSWAYFVVMIIYSVWRDTGSTVRLSLQGIVGTWIACLNIYILNGIAPGGITIAHYPEEHWALYALAFLDFFAVTIGLLWFNLEANVRVWALSYHVWFLMCYLNPQDRSFSEAWHLHQYTLEASHGLMAVCSAMASVLVTLLPTPILAGTKAAECARVTGQTQHEVLHRLCSKCIGTTRSDHRPRQGDSLQELQRQSQELEESVSAAYFECFGLGVRGFRWRLLSRHAEAIAALVQDMLQLQRWTEGGGGSCAAGEHQLAFGLTGSVPICLAKIIDRLAGESAALVSACAEAASDCGVRAPTETQSMAEVVKAAAGSVAELCRSLEQELPHGILECDHGGGCRTAAIAFIIGRIGQTTSLYASDMGMLLETHDRPRSCRSALYHVWYDIRTWLQHRRSSTKHSHSSRFVLRNGLSLSIAFIIGFAGCGTAILPYSSTLASTVALLVSATQLDDAVEKNLARLQGVTVGTAVGQMAHGLLGRRSMRGAIQTGLFLFGWEAVSVYVYFASSKLSYMACLCAAFGALEVLKGLKDLVPDDADYSQNYHTILYVVCAILIMTIVDLILLHRSSRGPVAKLVWKRLFDALATELTATFSGLSHALQPEDGAPKREDTHEQVGAQRGKILEMLHRAKAMAGDTDRNVFGLKTVGNLRMEFASRLNTQLGALHDELLTLDAELTVSASTPTAHAIGSGLEAQSATFAYAQFAELLEEVRGLLHTVVDQQIDDSSAVWCNFGSACLGELWRAVRRSRQRGRADEAASSGLSLGSVAEAQQPLSVPSRQADGDWAMPELPAPSTPASRADMHEVAEVDARAESVAFMGRLAEKVVTGSARLIVTGMQSHRGAEDALGRLAALLAGMVCVYRRLLKLRSTLLSASSPYPPGEASVCQSPRC